MNRLLGLIDNPEAHGRHAITRLGRVQCSTRVYKWGYAPCQLRSVCDHSHVMMTTTTQGGDVSYRCDLCHDFVKPDGTTGKFTVI